MKIAFFYPVGFALVFSLGILYICYPGFMSYDSIQMLEEARTSVKGGIFPTMPVYILRVFDLLGHGPAVMVLVQNFTLLLGIALIFWRLGASAKTVGVSMLMLLAIPTILGCMLVLWKDVTLVALIVTAVVVIFSASLSLRSGGKDDFTAKWVSLIVLVMATWVKFNAVTSTVVLLVYWVNVFYKSRSVLYKVLILLFLCGLMAFSSKLVNGYRIPSFERLSPNNIVYAIMANDLLGISKWSGYSLVPFDVAGSDYSPKSLISDIDAIYSSLGSAVMHDRNLKSGGRVMVYPPKFSNQDVFVAWVAAIRQYPHAYIRYRWDLFSEIIGAIPRATYEPTHYNGIDENRFGIVFRERWVTKNVLKYIEYSSGMFWGKPWFIFFLSSISIIVINIAREVGREVWLLSNYSYGAALFNVVPYFFITLSGEVRYSFAALVLCVIPVFVVCVVLTQRFLHRSGC